MKKFLIKIVIVAIILSLIICCFVGCNGKNENVDTDAITINVVMPDGAPTLAMAKLLYEKPSFDGFNVNYEIVSGSTAISAKAMDMDNTDIAILPTNMAAIMYNKGFDRKIVCSNVFGLLYMVGKTDITSIDQLKGKVVYNIGQGGTPDFVFKNILKENNIEYLESDTQVEGKVAIKFEASPQTVIQEIAANQVDYAILGEPQVSQALKLNENFHIVLDLQDEWRNGYPQVSTVIKSSIINEYPEFVDAFLAKIEENTTWVNENSDLAAQALSDNGSNVTGFTEEVIQRCNIRYIPISYGKYQVIDYLESIYQFNPLLVGGKMPEEALYA